MRKFGKLISSCQERLLDLFCGLGNFTLPIARRAAEVVGIEGEEGLVQRARDNAAANGIPVSALRRGMAKRMRSSLGAYSLPSARDWPAAPEAVSLRGQAGRQR